MGTDRKPHRKPIGQACLAGLAIAITALAPTLARARDVIAASCSPRVGLLARGYGSPDDVAVQGHRILFGDLTRNVLAAESGGRVTTLVSGLSVPEGIVVQTASRIVLVEQGANRLDTINLRTGRRQVLRTFVNLTGNEGIDGIGAAPNSGIYVPDSPYGRLYLLDRRGGLHLLASGLGRPVDAVQFQGGVAVPDEISGAIWFVSRGRVQRLATLSTPDDVVVFRGRLLADALGNGELWEIRPTVKLLLSGFGQLQGLAALDNSAVIMADSTRNALYSVSNLQSCF